jgi:hypothetical protein
MILTWLGNFRKAIASSTWITDTRSLGFSSFEERNYGRIMVLSFCC